jgi:hypothetical protein
VPPSPPPAEPGPQLHAAASLSAGDAALGVPRETRPRPRSSRGVGPTGSDHSLAGADEGPVQLPSRRGQPRVVGRSRRPIDRPRWSFRSVVPLTAASERAVIRSRFRSLSLRAGRCAIGTAPSVDSALRVDRNDRPVRSVRSLRPHAQARRRAPRAGAGLSSATNSASSATASHTAYANNPAARSLDPLGPSSWSFGRGSGGDDGPPIHEASARNVTLARPERCRHRSEFPAFSRSQARARRRRSSNLAPTASASGSSSYPADRRPVASRPAAAYPVAFARSPPRLMRAIGTRVPLIPGSGSIARSRRSGTLGPDRPHRRPQRSPPRTRRPWKVSAARATPTLHSQGTDPTVAGSRGQRIRTRAAEVDRTLFPRPACHQSGASIGRRVTARRLEVKLGGRSTPAPIAQSRRAPSDRNHRGGS